MWYVSFDLIAHCSFEFFASRYLDFLLCLNTSLKTPTHYDKKALYDSSFSSGY